MFVTVQEAEDTEAQCRGELEELQAQIHELDAQLCSQHPPPGAARKSFLGLKPEAVPIKFVSRAHHTWRVAVGQ